MSRLKDGGPAFPMATLSGAPPPFTGLTKLEYFVGQALAGMGSLPWMFDAQNPEASAEKRKLYVDSVAATAVEFAKAAMAACEAEA